MSDRSQTVLVVDDTPEDIAILESILKAEYRVKAVTNGPDALLIARGEEPPDLVLLDVMMPGMDGFEVCRELKKDSAGAMIPVIFLTAKLLRADEKAGLELGAVDYIRKPVDPDIVRGRVRAHLEQKERLLRISELKYRRLFETARDGIVILEEQSGVIIDANPAISAIMGTSQEHFLGRKVEDLDFLRVIMEQQAGISPSRRGQYVRYRDLPLRTYDGRRIFVEFVAGEYEVDGRLLRQINLRDITDLVEAERERDQFASRLAHYLSTSPTVTYSLSIRGGEERWSWVSENVREVLGYSSDEVLAPDWWFKNVSSIDRSEALGIVSDLARLGSGSREYRFARKDRSVAWLHDEMRFLGDLASGAEVVGTLTDVTARKKAEEELVLKGAALDAAANAVAIADRAGIVRWANAAFAAMAGGDPWGIAGESLVGLLERGRENDVAHRGMSDAIRAGAVWDGALSSEGKEGERADERVTITPVLDSRKAVSHFIAVRTDISEIVAARGRLEAALRQREILLREIHHRVNNNMQVIISLLNIASREIGDTRLHARFEDITRRVHAMAIVHEQFYQTKDLSAIDFAVYVQRLVESLKGEFPSLAALVSTDCPTGEAFLSLDKAVPAGLIVAELACNALKHAFPEGSAGGHIEIAQRVLEGGRLELLVRDDGIGIPAGIDPRATESMGMSVIRALVEQLGAELAFEPGPGTAARLRLPLDAADGPGGGPQPPPASPS